MPLRTYLSILANIGSFLIIPLPSPSKFNRLAGMDLVGHFT